MEGQSYLAINPDTLHDRNHWSYRDIQRLCKRLELGAKGSRLQLEDKLQLWHRRRDSGCRNVVSSSKDAQDVNISMNVVGNNFAILPFDIQVRAHPSPLKQNTEDLLIEEIGGGDQKKLNRKNASSRRRRSSLLPPAHSTLPRDQVVLVSPTILRPLKAVDSNIMTAMMMEDAKLVSILKGGRPLTPARRRMENRISFSPFNGVKVIPHRHSEGVNRLSIPFSCQGDNEEAGNDENDDSQLNSYQSEFLSFETF